jgi:hypothetical protein
MTAKSRLGGKLVRFALLAIAAMVVNASAMAQLNPIAAARIAADTAWSRVDKRIAACIAEGTHQSLEDMAYSAILPTDPRIAPWMGYCRNKVDERDRAERAAMGIPPWWTGRSAPFDQTAHAKHLWKQLPAGVELCIEHETRWNSSYLWESGTTPDDPRVSAAAAKCEAELAEKKAAGIAAEQARLQQQQAARDTVQRATAEREAQAESQHQADEEGRKAADADRAKREEEQRLAQERRETEARAQEERDRQEYLKRQEAKRNALIEEFNKTHRDSDFRLIIGAQPAKYVIQLLGQPDSVTSLSYSKIWSYDNLRLTILDADTGIRYRHATVTIGVTGNVDGVQLR